MLYYLGKFIFFLMSKLMFGLQVSGQENIPKKGGFILAGNHLSFLDPIILGVSCPRKLNFMARQDLFGNPIFGRILYAVGAFPVKRNSADLSAIKEAMRRVKNNKALLLFPEGRRKENTEPALEIQPGVGFLAAKLNVPVIPARIKGTQTALPKGAKFVRPAKVSVFFGRQVNIEKGAPYESIANSIMQDIQQIG